MVLGLYKQSLAESRFERVCFFHARFTHKGSATRPGRSGDGGSTPPIGTKPTGFKRNMSTDVNRR